MPGQLGWIFLTQPDPSAVFPRETDFIENFCSGGFPLVLEAASPGQTHSGAPSSLLSIGPQLTTSDPDKQDNDLPPKSHHAGAEPRV